MTLVERIKQRYLIAGTAERRFLYEYDEVRAFSLSRLYQHVKNPATSFGIISGYLTDVNDPYRTDEDNLNDTLDIAAAVRTAGFGYVWLKGYWKDPSGKQVEESSILVHAKKGDQDKLKTLLERLRSQYHQTAFAFKPEGTDKLFGVSKDGEVEYGSFQPEKIGEVYSRLAGGRHAGRPFIFASAHGLQTPSTHAFVKALVESVHEYNENVDV